MARTAHPASFPATGDNSDPAYQAKQDTFFEYTPYDSHECQSYQVCTDGGWAESSWLNRQYAVTPSIAQTFTTTKAPVYVSSDDVALLGTASASSAAPQQPPSGANDGIIGGYTADGTGDPTAEWSSNRERQGAWWRVDWDFPVAVETIIIYDRPNLDVSARLQSR